MLHEACIKADKPVSGHFFLEALQTPSCTRISLSRCSLFWHSVLRSLLPDLIQAMKNFCEAIYKYVTVNKQKNIIEAHTEKIRIHILYIIY